MRQIFDFLLEVLVPLEVILVLVVPELVHQGFPLVANGIHIELVHRIQ